MHATQRFAFAATLALALAGCGSSDPASTSEVTLAVRGGGAATYAISGTVSGADVTGQDFVSALGHAVSGTISGAVAEGVAVTLASTTGAAPVVTLTDATGRYAFTGIADGTYTLTPERSGFVFSLPSLTVTVSGADVGEQDFVSAVPTYMVSGTVSGAIAEGVTVTLSSSVTGTHQVATTDAAGRF